MLNVARAPLSDVVVDTVAEPQKRAKSSVFEEAKYIFNFALPTEHKPPFLRMKMLMKTSQVLLVHNTK